jgi:tripartite-type tricarboxylate transporter receptor subunit TctC
VLTSAFITFVNMAWSQTARTIKVIVPFPPGGAATVLTRLLAEEISRTYGPTIVVENRPGAGTAIGTEAVARAAADGNTLLITNLSLVINPHLHKQNYDPLTGFAPVCNLVNVPYFFAVNSASPYRTLAEFVGAARAKPGEFTVASVTATGGHITAEVFRRKANADMTFVPYPGSAPMVTALLGGHITAIVDNYAAMAEHINAGKLHALATFWPTRVEELPGMPTAAESGYNEAQSWFGLFAPANVPTATMGQLISWTSAAMQVPDVKRKLEPLGLYPAKMCGAEFAALIKEQYDEFGRAIREANIKED